MTVRSHTSSPYDTPDSLSLSHTLDSFAMTRALCLHYTQTCNLKVDYSIIFSAHYLMMFSLSRILIVAHEGVDSLVAHTMRHKSERERHCDNMPWRD